MYFSHTQITLSLRSITCCLEISWNLRDAFITFEGSEDGSKEKNMVSEREETKVIDRAARIQELVTRRKYDRQGGHDFSIELFP